MEGRNLFFDFKTANEFIKIKKKGMKKWKSRQGMRWLSRKCARKRERKGKMMWQRKEKKMEAFGGWGGWWSVSFGSMGSGGWATSSLEKISSRRVIIRKLS